MPWLTLIVRNDICTHFTIRFASVLINVQFWLPASLEFILDQAGGPFSHPSVSNKGHPRASDRKSGELKKTCVAISVVVGLFTKTIESSVILKINIYIYNVIVETPRKYDTAVISFTKKIRFFQGHTFLFIRAMYTLSYYTWIQKNNVKHFVFSIHLNL